MCFARSLHNTKRVSYVGNINLSLIQLDKEQVQCNPVQQIMMMYTLPRQEKMNYSDAEFLFIYLYAQNYFIIICSFLYIFKL